jgi:hypothetical protein
LVTENVNKSLKRRHAQNLLSYIINTDTWKIRKKIFKAEVRGSISISLHRFERVNVKAGVFLWRNASERRSESFFQKDASRNGVLELFSGIDIINASPPLTEFLITLHSGTYFLYKNRTGVKVIFLNQLVYFAKLWLDL